MKESIRILCIDDEPNIRKTLQRFGRTEGYEILTAASAAEGLELLSREAPVHIVISDFRMPGMNGVDFIRQVRRHWPGVFGIVLSGYAHLPAVSEALEQNHIDRFLPKPWDRKELKQAILQAYDLHRSRRRQEPAAEGDEEEKEP